MGLLYLLHFLHEDQHKFFIYLHQFLLQWENFQAKVAGKIETSILFSTTFFFENRAVYDDIT